MSIEENFNKLFKLINDPGSYHSSLNKIADVNNDDNHSKISGVTIINTGIGYLSTPVITTATATTASAYIGSTNNTSITSGSTFSSPYYATSGFTGSYTPASYATNIITLYNRLGKKVVELNEDGKVTWANGIEVDEAAEAFGRSLNLSAEQKIGITSNVKMKMRDSVFNDLIDIAKEKGPLSVEDLQYLLSASKIVEKLKGKE